MLFYQKGYTATSVADVAEAANVAKGNLTYYFKTKDDLMRAVSAARHDTITQRINLWLDSAQPPDVCIEAFIRYVESTAEDFMRFGCPLATISDELGKEHLELQEDANKNFYLLRDFLQLQFKATYPDLKARIYAEHLLVMAEGAAVMSHTFRDATLVHRIAETMREWVRTKLPQGVRTSDSDASGR